MGSFFDMTLLPSLRQRKRYVAYAVESTAEFSAADFQQAVQAALLSFLGHWGTARAAPRLVKEVSGGNHFVLKVQATEVDRVKAALLFIKKIKNIPVLLQSLTVSGALKKACLRGGIHATKANDR